MRRREFITLLSGSVATWPFAAHAQQPANIARIGFLGPASASSWADRLEAFRVRLRDLGYVEGQNIVIDSRWADEKYNRLPELAAELVDHKVDVIVTYGTPGTLAAMRATKTIPIIMAYSGDALSAGLVTSLARPGGNVTGSTYFLSELMAKRLELLKAAMPQITKAAVLVNPGNPLFDTTLKALEIAAKSMNIDLQQIRVAGLLPDDSAARVPEYADRLTELAAHNWTEAAISAAYHCQIGALHLKLWQEPPCVADEDDPDERDKQAERLLRRMLTAGLSDPRTALAKKTKRRRLMF